MKKQAASFRILACRRLTVGIERQRPASSGCFPISRNSFVKKTVRGCPFSKTVREADGVWAEVSG